MTKIDSLTGLRLFAALAVFGSHVPRPGGLPDVASTFMQSGYNGVTLFFVLSGFVLTYTYADRLAEPDWRSLWNFAVARFARIAPLYFAAMALAVLVFQTGWPEGAWLHLFALQTWSGSDAVAFGLNGPAWSIGVETFLYATFPLVLLASLRLDRRQLPWVLGGSVVVLAAVTAAVYLLGMDGHRWLYRTPVTRLPDFVVGVTLALMVMGSERASRWAPAVQWASFASVVALMCSDRVLLSVVSWDLAYLVPFAALIWSLAMGETTLLARLLANRAVVRGGLISYALYLFHVPFLHLVNVDRSTTSAWLLTGGLALLLALAAATAAHVVIERPAQRWLRRRLSVRAGSGRAEAPRRQPVGR